MSEHHPISDLMTETMSKIKEMVDVNTIIGNPISGGRTTVIPVSKVSFGFGAGGSEFASKHAASGSPLAFGGGSGAGVTVSPVCFLVIGRDGSANILGINAQASDTVDRLVEMIPGAINKVSNFVSGFRARPRTQPKWRNPCPATNKPRFPKTYSREC
ncbi:MAG: GerW family sporulation protein [Butyricicoccus sp.]